MAYWTLDGLYGVLPKEHVLALVADDGETDIIVSPPNAAYDFVADAGAKADAVIDTYLRGHYTVPLTTVPTVVAEIAAILQAVNVYLRSDTETIPEKLQKRYEWAMRFLEHVRDEKLKLFDEQRADTTILVNKTADDRIFPKSVLDQW
jgi:phage gp36-like protein